MGFFAFTLLAAASGALLRTGVIPAPTRACALRSRTASSPVCFETLAKTSGTHGAPSDAECAVLVSARPQPALQPREVIETMIHALHRSNWDHPQPYFGFEVALRFLSPSHQYRSYEKSKKYTAQSFQRYLRQPHKAKLLSWGEYRWDGDVTLIQGEAYQQISVRAGPEDEWASVRWLLTRVSPAAAAAAASSGKAGGGVDAKLGASAQTQWMVDAVFMHQPDGGEDDVVADDIVPLDERER